MKVFLTKTELNGMRGTWLLRSNLINVNIFFRFSTTVLTPIWLYTRQGHDNYWHNYLIYRNIRTYCFAKENYLKWPMFRFFSKALCVMHVCSSLMISQQKRVLWNFAFKAWLLTTTSTNDTWHDSHLTAMTKLLAMNLKGPSKSEFISPDAFDNRTLFFA